MTGNQSSMGMLRLKAGNFYMHQISEEEVENRADEDLHNAQELDFVPLQ